MKSERDELRVILLEDSTDISSTIERFLGEDQANDYRINKYEDANTALQAIRTIDQVNLFIVDLKLPRKTSGYDFLRIVQEEGLFPDAPRMIVSDLNRNHLKLSGRRLTMENLIEVGVADFVDKSTLWLNEGGEQFVLRVKALIESSPRDSKALQISPNPQYFLFKSGVYLALVAATLAIIASLISRLAFLNGSLGLLALAATIIGLAASNNRRLGA